MRIASEWQLLIERRRSLLEMYIDSVAAEDIKNLTIKEEWIMLERLKEQREVYVAELEELKKTDLEAIKNARFELVKEMIAKEVEDELNAKLAAVELKVSHYDFVIADEEEKAKKELEAEIEATNDEQVVENETIGG